VFHKSILKNGLRCVTIPLSNTKAVTALVMIGAGSKYETKKTNGVAHFLEHMMFKGTRKRPTALEISSLLDGVGAQYNAFTSKEYTGYYIKVDEPHLELALDVLSDAYRNSLYAQGEIGKERGVIIEEINRYLDNPARHLGDLWESLLYGDQPAGWTIAGEKENILSMQREDFLAYLRAHYTAPNTTVVVAGSFPKERIKLLVQSYFGKLSPKRAGTKQKVREAQKAPGVFVFPKKTDQAHLAVGVRTYPFDSPKRPALAVLSTILGGGMSSRLFIEVREKRGLAYDVHTSPEHYTDSGYLVTQAGVRLDAAETALQTILVEYKKIAQRGIAAKELKKAKEYLKGGLVLNLETSDAYAFFFGEQEALRERLETPDEKIKRIERVSAREVQEVARDIFKDAKLNAAFIGPFEKPQEEKFKKILTLS